MNAIETLKFYLILGQEITKSEYLGTLKYKILDSIEFSQNEEEAQLNKIYWTEILTRAHWAAITSIIRNCKWIDGILLSEKYNNFLSFSSSLRALIESSGDSLTSLDQVPKTLAHNFTNIRNSINGKVTDKIIGGKELEEALIHFVFAQSIHKKEQKENQISDMYVAQSNVDYISILDNRVKDGPIYSLYKILCQITHPAVLSITYGMNESHSDNITEVTFVGDPDRKAIDEILKNSEKEIITTCQYSFNKSIMLLKTINYFNIEEVKTPDLDKWSFDHIKSWKDIQNKIASA